ncbi:hypothetical protein AMS68_005017 [Peltaster fructicola]|uniref:RNB domain-containing protein n=1 Tax=Peltaster fructicola TaxID=286661 RepID=A0A6H0XYK6_9PEZI|nr:hypothetical protein AMS68_005017 [Peltaster fructicola]
MDPPGGIRDRLRLWQLNNRGRADLDLSASSTTADHYLQQGDLVLLCSPQDNTKTELAVYVRGNETEGQFYTILGRWHHTAKVDAIWSSSGWASPELVERIIPHLPSFDDIKTPSLAIRAAFEDLSVPREAGTPLIEMMLAHERESKELYRKHATVLDNAHGLLSHDTDLRYGSLSSVAMHLLKMERAQLTPLVLYTVRRALSVSSFGFCFDKRTHRSTGFLQIRSKSQMKMIQEITNWVRQWQETVVSRASSTHSPGSEVKGVIPDFIAVARDVVNKSRKTRDFTEHGSIGPSKVRRKLSAKQDSVKVLRGREFSQQHQRIIEFLESYACSRLFNGEARLCSIPPMILKATGLYDVTIDWRTVWVFLQELGVALPYENAMVYDPHLMLPISKHSRPLVQLAASLASESRQGFQFKDSMKALRRDWRDMPVYCIDGESAHEIDDGVSIEHIGVQGECWAHIHIANPTAFLDTRMPISRMARHMGETVYSPDRTHMMLPPSATQTYWSLAPQRASLTFSARLDRHGNMLETKIQPGIVHNVKRFTPEAVDRMLKPDYTPKKELVLVVGGEVPPGTDHARQSNPTPEDKTTLTGMFDIAQVLYAKRKAAGGFNFDTPSNDVDVWTSWSRKGLAYSPLSMDSSRTVEGDPVIRMRTAGFHNPFRYLASLNRASSMVQEYMLLAAEIAARWCAERQIPSLFRGTHLMKDHLAAVQAIPKEEYWTTVCEPAMRANNGALPYRVGLGLQKYLGFSTVSTDPIKHDVLGLSHYVKVTSPLRRYGDMIAHWQIEAALRHEAQTGRSMITSNRKEDRSFLPFSKTTLETFMIGYQAREKLILQAKTRSSTLWQAMLIFRAFHFNELKLPFETCRCNIIYPPVEGRPSVQGLLEELNMRAVMWLPSSYPQMAQLNVQHGDVWECAIDSVDMTYQRPVLRPLRLLDRSE